MGGACISQKHQKENKKEEKEKSQIYNATSNEAKVSSNMDNRANNQAYQGYGRHLD